MAPGLGANYERMPESSPLGVFTMSRVALCCLTTGVAPLPAMNLRGGGQVKLYLPEGYIFTAGLPTPLSPALAFCIGKVTLAAAAAAFPM